MKLTFDKISKSYRKTMNLIGFSAELEPGIYALLGPNGSGKSDYNKLEFIGKDGNIYVEE